MELEGARFPTRLQNNVSDLRRDVIEFSSQIPFRRGTVTIDDEDTNEREDGDDIDGKTNDSQPYTENMNDIYVLHAHHPSFSTSETALSLHYHNNSHERSMKIALDEDTVLTGKRIPNQRFQVAYCPQMISSMVLESLETLFNEFRGEPRRSRWNRIMELFRSVFRSPPPPLPQQQLQRFQSSTDWLLHQLYLSVSGSAPTSSVVKWYTTFITDLNLSPPESRIVVVAICFDINGSIAHISGITSSKSAFRVFGN